VPEPWQPERVVSPAEAAELIEAQMPDLRPVTIGQAWTGWDNTVYEVNGALVFRFPRREVAVPLLETELRVLPRLARLPLAVAIPERVGRPTDAYPWPFAGYRRLPGATADRLRLDEAQRAELAAPLGRFLAALHAIPAAGLDLPGDDWGRLDFSRRLPLFRARAAALGLEQADAWAVELDAAPSPRARALVHGDLYARALLIDGGRVAGVIDWGDLHLGDPAVDLALAHGFLGPAGHADFRAAYGPIDDDTWRLARLRAIFHAAAVLTYARDVHDDDLEWEARTALSQAGLRGRNAV
jgi:aminoglycoside phosphotransferase (APT) family kinase protein